MTPPTEPQYRVPLEAGLWAVVLVVAAALLLTAVVRALPRSPLEPPVSCCVPGSQGRHPLGPAGDDGIRRCECGSVALVPAATSPDVQLARVAVPDPARPVDLRGLSLAGRTDTRELHALDADTDEHPLPVGYWSRP